MGVSLGTVVPSRGENKLGNVGVFMIDATVDMAVVANGTETLETVDTDVSGVVETTVLTLVLPPTCTLGLEVNFVGAEIRFTAGT